MIYKNLIKNNNTLNELLLFYKKNKLPNAFIFHGNEGVGKEAHAIEFFGLLNCTNSKVDNACGNCNSCKKIKILQHELLHIVTPLPKSKSLSKNEHPLKALNEKQKSNLIDLYKSGYTILVSSLQLSASGNVFEEVRDMMPWATKIEICPAVCPVTGRDAYYTHRKVEGLSEIAVGGADMYEPRCWEYHTYMNCRE